MSHNRLLKVLLVVAVALNVISVACLTPEDDEEPKAVSRPPPPVVACRAPPAAN